MSGLHSGGTVGSLIVSAVARFGDAPAIADGKIRWSYRQFGETVGRFISLLRAVGLKKGDAVSILSRFCPATAPNPGPRYQLRW
jgi:fatty-acyl-CoA synthase